MVRPNILNYKVKITGGDMISPDKSLELENSEDGINVLVVDDDTTCLSIVAAMLRKFEYEVEAVNHPMEALNTLRTKPGEFDLVLSDVHMPDINGFELLQLIAQEFNVPVALMSADDRESTAEKGLENGAVLFLSKPISPEDIKDLWQFVATENESQVVIVDSLTSSDEEASSTGDF